MDDINFFLYITIFCMVQSDHYIYLSPQNTNSRIHSSSTLLINYFLNNFILLHKHWFFFIYGLWSIEELNFYYSTAPTDRSSYYAIWFCKLITQSIISTPSTMGVFLFTVLLQLLPFQCFPSLFPTHVAFFFTKITHPFSWATLYFY